MTEKKKIPVSPLEWKVMRIVCDLKSCTARDVYQITEKEYKMHRGTTRTLLRRLVDKGYLKAKQVGNYFVYEPQESLLDSIIKDTEILFHNALGGTLSPLVLHMVKKGKLSQKDINELQVLLEEHHKGGQKKWFRSKPSTNGP